MNVEGSSGSQRRSSPYHGIVSNAILSAGFALTGTGIVMLGVILPALSKKWSLQDDQLGSLLFLQFFGSALGAVFSGLNRIRSLTMGYGLTAAALCALIFSGPLQAYGAFLVYGVGLGMAMTSTSQLFSDRWGGERAAKLEWLNFVWSVGATLGPVCFIPFLRRWAFESIFPLMLSLFLLVFCWVLFFERGQAATAPLRSVQQAGTGARIVFSAFLIVAMCSVGIEASLSGWLTTYSNRAGIHSIAGASFATSLFWFGEMVSRLIFSTRVLAKVGRAAVLTWGIFGVTGSMVALIVFPQPASILIVAGAAGYFLGPLYPLALSYLMELSPWGWFFASAGVGAAAFPWMTGLISSHFHSLRYGLAVPCSAGVIMIAVILFAYRSNRATAPVVPVHDNSI